MTSPALFVLSIAFVCSIRGIVMHQPADHDFKKNMKLSKRDTNMNNKWIKQFNQQHISDIENFTEKDRNSIGMYNEDDIQITKFTKTRNNIQMYKDNYNEITNLTEEPGNHLKMYRWGNIKVSNLVDKTTNSIKKIDEDDIEVTNFNKYKMNLKKRNKALDNFERNSLKDKRIKREVGDPCKPFYYEDGVKQITHPYLDNPSKYSKNITCVTVISSSNEHEVIQLTFVDMFHIEDHANCEYDYLEVRDGLYGYANRIGKVCGQAFPTQMTTTGPYAWVKFHSDDTIEYEGFKINIDFIPEPGNSHKIPDACLNMKFKGYSGVIDSDEIDQACLTGSQNQALDVLWTIETPAKTKIFLNFTTYVLQKPNECEDNVIQVFGAIMEMDVKLKQYCGSIANYVMTSDGDSGNIMHVRYYASKAARKGSKFNATFNAFRSLSVDPTSNDQCDPVEEFDCEDSTCIHHNLRCDDLAHCRLKTDEESCDKNVTKSTIYELHITVILIIFSLILFGMTFVFIFKCIRKLIKDHKIIQKHLKQSCEDRLDSSRLTLDPKRLQMESEPRASLERENHTNEMYREQRSMSRHKQSSIESEYIQETHLDLDEEPWRREVDSMPVEAADIRIERNGRTRRSDISKKEESIRSRTKASDESREKEKKEIRDVSVGAPDTKESGCQTRESLFQTDPPQSSEGSGTNSRGFSTFGYSGATIARPSPPATTNTSEITIELIKPQETKPHKKVDRRPISTETTRSAPDVIIVSKPIR